MWSRQFVVFGPACTLGVTLAACVTGAALLRRQLVWHDAAVVGDLVTLVWTVGGSAGVLLSAMLFGLVRNAARSESARERELAVHAHALEQRVAEDRNELVRKTGELSVLSQQLSAAEAFFGNLIESSVDAIVTLSPRGRITFVSQGGRRMFGYAAADVVGTPVGRYWARGGEDLRAFRRQLGAQGRVQSHDTELQASDGRTLAVNLSASRLRNGDGATYGVIAIVRDVTELRRLQERMIRGEQLAATGLLAAGVAHEIGNALTCVSSLCQMLASLAVEPRLRQGLRDVLGHADRIDRILQDLTRLARPRPFQIAETALAELLDTAVRLARHHRVVHPMRIVTTVEPALPAIHVSADHLQQVFVNLILNAAESGGDLTIAAARDGDAVRVEFRDTGCGMSAEQLERLFDPFFSTKEGAGARGLGLFVCHEIVRHHQGRIAADSRPGVGSTVTVTLPLHER
jgi:PAS domain S-box-containing protein